MDGEINDSSGLIKGDRVFRYSNTKGCWMNYIFAHEKNLCRIYENLDDATALEIYPALAAFLLLKSQNVLRTGEMIVLTNPLIPMGFYINQLARKMHFGVINLVEDKKSTKAEILKEMNPDALILKHSELEHPACACDFYTIQNLTVN